MPRLAAPILVSLLIPLAAGSTAAADGDWLPAPVEEGMARQLAGWLAPEAPAGALAAASRSIGEMRHRVEAWGVDGALARAPEFDRLPVPRHPEPHLDAMARYQICNMVLYLRFEGRGDGELSRARVARGLSAMTMAILRLREPIVAAGGGTADIEAHLTGPEMEVVLEGIQREPELFAHVESRCAPLLAELLDGVTR